MRNLPAVTLSNSRGNATAYLLLALSLPLFLWVMQTDVRGAFPLQQFLFFHTAVEIAAVVIAILIFVTGYRAILWAREDAVVLLGVAFLGVALLDFLHVLSYAGLPDALTSNSPHKSMVFWIAARLLSALALLAYALWRPAAQVSLLYKQAALGVTLAAVALIAWFGLVHPSQVPLLFVPGRGPTSLKTGLEWLVACINAGTVLVISSRPIGHVPERPRQLGIAAAFMAVSALFFTAQGVTDIDSSNALGHIYKILGYLFLFDATCNEALRRPLRRLELQHLRERTILDAAPDGILWVDDTGCILMANAAVESLTGYLPSQLIGQNVAILLPEHFRAGHGQSIQQYFRTPNARAMGLVDIRLLCRDGAVRPVDISLGHFRDGSSKYAIAYIRDLTERKRHEESLRHQATHDELTGLPNRWLFRYQLDQAIARAGRSKHAVAVMFLDLDRFKSINDSFGHLAGDELLVQVGARIRAVLRDNDVVARLGGDEFAVSLSDLDSVEEAIHVAGKIVQLMQSTFFLTSQNVHSGVSLGLAFFPGDAKDSDTLLRYADMAMYQAKQAGRGGYACYSHEMDVQAQDDMLLHTRLKEAMALGLLELHYQPQVDVNSGRVIGAEALLRWHDTVLGVVSPERFIRIAESTGLILRLSEWVLATACEQIAAWNRAGTPLPVSVNFSAQQFRQTGLAETVAAALASAGAPANLLCVEITETVAMAQPELANTQLSLLAQKGCSISLDDFGTGYSSLAYLKELPISQLKIDRSFVEGLPGSTHDAAITRAIITLAHSLNMTLVAEGVENLDQLAFLRAHDCECFQGWLFAKAVSASEFQRYLPQLATVSAGSAGSAGSAAASAATDSGAPQPGAIC